ncbi:sarcosine oxidase subunit gamma [Paracoccus sp. (in: a-proteobacteria)]|uniref:sarcosine oxidase subunit gamma n=1 Tax=Paracoccus sp. TaxID=267 RepID=UPI00396C9C01
MTNQKHQFHAVPVVIEELAPQTRFSLRVKPQNRAALAAALGLELPAKVGACARSGENEVLCLGPDEWMILAPQVTGLADAARAVYATAPHSLVEVSDREVTLRLSGPQVLELLATCCPRNLATMRPGTAARTVFDTATVVLWRDGATEFRMDVWRSFLPHVRALLAMAETELKAGL